jgi:hypothetical protein
LAGYYRKFVKHFGIISRTLTNLFKKNTIFVWTANHELAFTTLKNCLVSTPVLSLPDFTKTFVIEIDACAAGVGVVLMHESHPLAFLSKALRPKSQGLSTYEKEYMAILLVVQQLRPYLRQAEFHIYIDHKSLSQLNEQMLHTIWQHKVNSKLVGIQYKVIYKKGSYNRVADALSRRMHASDELCSISPVIPQWI